MPYPCHALHCQNMENCKAEGSITLECMSIANTTDPMWMLPAYSMCLIYVIFDVDNIAIVAKSKNWYQSTTKTGTSYKLKHRGSILGWSNTPAVWEGQPPWITLPTSWPWHLTMQHRLHSYLLCMLQTASAAPCHICHCKQPVRLIHSHLG